MLFDPRKREALPPAMKAGIAQVMQYALLDEIFGANAWTAKDIVFQGGTSIHVVWNSPRYSEDLDFLVSEDKVSEIEKSVEKAARGIRARLMMSLPGSDINIKYPKKPEAALREVRKYDIVWSHPQKHGIVKVNLEFFVVEPKHIERYHTGVQEHNPDEMMIRSRPELADFNTSDLKVRSLIPAALPESLYGDKLVAISKRRYLKARDFFDLWWLQGQMGVNIPDHDLYDVVKRSADCYDYTDQDLVEGIEYFHTNPPEIAREIERNLATFLPKAVYDRLVSDTNGLGQNAFDMMYEHAMAETSRLADVLRLKMDNDLQHENEPAPGMHL